MSDREKAREAYRKIEDRCVTCTADDCREAGVEIILEYFRTAREEGRRQGLEEAEKIANYHGCTDECFTDHGQRLNCNRVIGNIIRSQKEVGR